MPISWKANSAVPLDNPQYFESLQELDAHYSKASSFPKQRGVLPFCPRRSASSNVDDIDGQHGGRLLVCHDYKGGYVESPSALSYTFNFWQYCESFVYFSHYRITIPPSGWTNAAHRQGVKMLGTLIFEGNGEADMLRILVGPLPSSTFGSAVPSVNSNNTALPISAHYATLLAQVAYERGFDGYLLNVECPLRGGPEQVRALDAWVTVLRAEMRRIVGVHSSVVWYDSVIINGQLRWQDRLNSLNLPFFLSSDQFFTNYTWPIQYPSVTAQYILSLDPSLLQPGTSSKPSHDLKTQEKAKSLQDIYIGVDTWGRGSHGGGGFYIYKAIEHIDPQFLGLSVALFGQAWTWESEEGEADWNWEKWWRRERMLWIGPSDGEEGVEIKPAEANLRQGEQPCEQHGEFKPISSFFSPRAPPDPRILPLFSTFSPGVGQRWFVEGKEVMQRRESDSSKSGWTDVDKQTSLGDSLWPVPTVKDEGIENDESDADISRKNKLPKAAIRLSFDDAWNGGSSVVLSLANSKASGSWDTDPSFRCFWVPVQSLSITPGHSYDATLVYKLSYSDGVDMNVYFSCKLLQDSKENEITADTISDSVVNGWNQVTIRFSYSLMESNTTDIPVYVGLTLPIAAEEGFLPAYDISVTLGQLTVHPTPPPNIDPYEPRVMWADYTLSTIDDKDCVTVTWDVGSAYTGSINLQSLTSAEDPNPIWKLDHSLTAEWYPKVIYCNIYAIARSGASQTSTEGLVLHPSNATFLGTSGLDGVYNRVIFQRALLPDGINRSGGRLYIQPITDRGIVLPWEKCAYVDYKKL